MKGDLKSLISERETAKTILDHIIKQPYIYYSTSFQYISPNCFNSDVKCAKSYFCIMNHPGGAENIINQIEPETVILYDVNAWWWWFDRSRLYKGTWPRIDYLGFWYLTRCSLWSRFWLCLCFCCCLCLCLCFRLRHCLCFRPCPCPFLSLVSCLPLCWCFWRLYYFTGLGHCRSWRIYWNKLSSSTPGSLRRLCWWWLLPCGSGGYGYGCTSFGGPRQNACLESPSWLLWWLLCGS